MKISLKYKIILTVILIVLFFGVVSIYSVFTYSKSTLIENKQDLLMSLNTEVAHEIWQVFNHAKMVVKTIASRDYIIDYLSDKDYDDIQNLDILDNLKHYNINNIYSDIHVINIKGDVLISTNESFLEENLNFRSYFKRTLAGRAYADFIFGVDEEDLGYYFSYPVFSEGEILGVVVTKIKPDFIHNYINLGERTGESNIMLVNNQGVIIYSEKKDLIFKSLGELNEIQKYNLERNKSFPTMSIEPAQYSIVQDQLDDIHKSKIFEFYDQEKEREELMSIAKVINFPFFVIIEQDLKSYLQSAVYIARTLAILVGLSVLSVILLISLLLSRFLKPLQALHDAAIKVAKGNYSGYLDDSKGTVEFRELSHAFNLMMRNLAKNKKVIDKKVRKQTKELREKQKDMEDQQKITYSLLKQTDKSKKEIEKERDKIGTILNSIGEGVFVVDKNSRITVCNKMTSKISGFSGEELVGSVFNEKLKFIDEKTGKLKDDFIKKTIETGEIHLVFGNTVLVKKDGLELAVENRATPLLDKKNKVIGCVVVFRDVSHQREVEKIKTDFVSVASHQLRTPLTTIRWFIEELYNEEIGPLNKDQEEYLKSVLISINRMVHLVNSLLNVKRLESGRLNIRPEPTNLVKLIKDVIRDEVIALKAKKGKQCVVNFIKPDEPIPDINIDESLIRQVLQNFISNAVKYTKITKGKCLVDVKLEKTAENLMVSVKDNGVGIPEDLHERLFEKFFRADNIIKLEAEGIGLGLYISKMIIEDSGGEIWFESKQGEGSTFHFTLPLLGSKAHRGEKGLEI